MASDEQVVQQRVHLVAGGVEVGDPVVPQVEAQARGAQGAPAGLHEVPRRVLAPQQPVLDGVLVGVEEAAGGDDGAVRVVLHLGRRRLRVALGERRQALGQRLLDQLDGLLGVAPDGGAPLPGEAPPAALEVGDDLAAAAQLAGRRAGGRRCRCRCRRGSARSSGPGRVGVRALGLRRQQEVDEGVDLVGEHLGVVDDVLADVEVVAGPPERVVGVAQEVQGRVLAQVRDVVVGPEVPRVVEERGAADQLEPGRPPPGSPAAGGP